MSARSLLQLYAGRPDRAGEDRLEILTALAGGPSFDPVYRPDVIKIPRGHAIYRWECVVGRCERTRSGGTDLCAAHLQEWARAREAGGAGKAAFVSAAQGLDRHERAEQAACRVCPGRPAVHTRLRLCQRHLSRFRNSRAAGGDAADFGHWLAGQDPLEGYGTCRVTVCPDLAASPLGLCSGHATRYANAGRPGGASLPRYWSHCFEQQGLQVSLAVGDEQRFGDWCAREWAMPWPGQVNLRGLRPLLRAEIRWTLFVNSQQPRPCKWDLGWIQKLANLARDLDAGSLTSLDLDDFPRFHRGIAKSMLHHLRLVYFTPSQTRDAGFIETDHFGIRFPDRASHVDLTAVSQRWLRDLLWDYLASLMRSPRCPRTAMPLDEIRRAATELGAFLEVEAPGGGHDPAALRAELAQRFVADQGHRARRGLPSLAMKTTDGAPSTVTDNTRCVVANGVRKLLRDALESGVAGQLGLDREFITAMPAPGYSPGRTARRPFPDEVAHALASETSLARLAEAYDLEDQGMRDVWEAIVLTGRRVNEVLKVRLECIGRYGGLAMFWHDQTKVGNYDAAIRIPEQLYDTLAARQRKTLDRFTARSGRTPTGAERAAMALFPSKVRNAAGTTSLSYQWFWVRFRPWVDDLDLGHYVAHQARHTLATNLLRHGATLTHIRRYLGQVSERMAEHYVHLSHSDLENVLQHVWVAGPGTASPGELLAGQAAAPLTREQAQAIAVDLARRSTPAEGGFCTFQPVVDGGACPWNMDCHNCSKFVMSGADLIYWQRKREQWRLLAEGAPDDATAAYLHGYFEPTARAIDGLEKALAGLGLLDDALALDLRKPQDYFHRVWSTAFRASDLTVAGSQEDEHDDTGGNDHNDDTGEPNA